MYVKIIILKKNEETGQIEEPFESVEVRVPEEYVGGVVDLLNQRKGELQDMGLEAGEGLSTVKYLVPTRGMLGLRSSMLSATRGTAIIDSVFDSYRPKIPEEILSRDKGSLLAFADGKATTFGIEGAQDRGKMFIKPQDDVYKGMVRKIRAIGYFGATETIQFTNNYFNPLTLFLFHNRLSEFTNVLVI